MFPEKKEVLTCNLSWISRKPAGTKPKNWDVWYEARQFGGVNLAGDNLAAQICPQANLATRQFGGKIKKNDLYLKPNCLKMRSTRLEFRSYWSSSVMHKIIKND